MLTFGLRRPLLLLLLLPLLLPQLPVQAQISAEEAGVLRELCLESSVLRERLMDCDEAAESLTMSADTTGDWSPEVQFDATKTTVIKLNFEFTAIPETVGIFANLTHLTFDSAGLSTLPMALSSLRKLKIIQLDNNTFTEFPVVICDLKALTDIHMNSNQLSSLPECAGELASLIRIRFDDNQLSSIPLGLTSKALQVVFLNSNNFTSLPTSVFSSWRPFTFEMANNHLTSLPGEIGEWRNIGALRLRGNQLTSLPTQISSFYNLNLFDVSYNKLTRVPPELTWEMSALTTVDLSYNQLTALPATLANTTIKYLYLAGNQITEISPEFANSTFWDVYFPAEANCKPQCPCFPVGTLGTGTCECGNGMIEGQEVCETSTFSASCSSSSVCHCEAGYFYNSTSGCTEANLLPPPSPTPDPTPTPTPTPAPTVATTIDCRDTVTDPNYTCNSTDPSLVTVTGSFTVSVPTTIEGSLVIPSGRIVTVLDSVVVVGDFRATNGALELATSDLDNDPLIVAGGCVVLNGTDVAFTYTSTESGEKTVPLFAQSPSCPLPDLGNLSVGAGSGTICEAEYVISEGPTSTLISVLFNYSQSDQNVCEGGIDVTHRHDGLLPSVVIVIVVAVIVVLLVLVAVVFFVAPVRNAVFFWRTKERFELTEQ